MHQVWEETVLVEFEVWEVLALSEVVVPELLRNIPYLTGSQQLHQRQAAILMILDRVINSFMSDGMSDG